MQVNDAALVLPGAVADGAVDIHGGRIMAVGRSTGVAFVAAGRSAR